MKRVDLYGMSVNKFINNYTCNTSSFNFGCQRRGAGDHSSFTKLNLRGAVVVTRAIIFVSMSLVATRRLPFRWLPFPNADIHTYRIRRQVGKNFDFVGKLRWMTQKLNLLDKGNSANFFSNKISGR